MTTLSYFQRYSLRENHLTNNTLLMLRHLYTRSPGDFDYLISELCEIECKTGLSFEQQVSDASDYCFDGLISQSQINMYIETKLDTGLESSRIRDYIEYISSNVGIDNSTRNRTILLIGLTSGELDRERHVEYTNLANENNIRFVHITFQQLVNVLETICTNGNTDLSEIYQDFEDYLRQEGVLIQDVLKAFPCRHTLNFNLRHHMYTVGANTARYLNARVIGFYQNKCITHVADINAIVEGVYHEQTGSFEVLHHLRGDGDIDDESINRIIAMNKECRYHIGDNFRYYLLDEIYETEFVKTSKYGLQRVKNFLLGSILDGYRDGETPIQEIAQGLRDETW